MNPSPKNTLLAVCFAMVASLLLPGCASTALENEGAVGGVTKLSFKKLVVFAPFRDPERRKTAEDELKSKITRVECIPSYTILPNRSDLKDLEKVRAAIHATGADGIVLMRPTYYMTESEVSEGKTRNVTSVSSTSFGGYYGGYYGAYAGDYEVRQFSYQDPDTVRNTKVLQIETTIYEVAGEKRVWYGRVISNNPSNVRQLTSDAVDAIRATMVRDDLIAPPAK
jgi:hypothetical protein